MSEQVSSRRQEIIDEILKHIQDRVPQKQFPLLKTFVPRYYVSTALADLYEHQIPDLAGAIVSHWNFIYQRQPGECKVRVFNPTLENDGWQSTHTIIEISHDDIPFLVDSVRMELNHSDLQIHFIIHFGGLRLKRDKNGCITDILPVGDMEENAHSEAPIYIEIDRQTDSEFMLSICQNIQRVLKDVRVSVQDWRAMLQRAEEALLELEQNPPPLDPAEIAESKDFLRWITNNNFTFLGSRDYRLIGNEGNRALEVVPGTGLGVLRENGMNGTISRRYAELPPEARKLALSKNILIIAKTNTPATVHRSAYTDYIGVKQFNEKGDIIGERRFIGLYTSSAYHASPRQIPFLRHKVAKIMQELHFPPDSHNGKEVLNILETLPRDDLFQATQDELLKLTMGILHLQERKRLRLFIRKDSYGRYFSALVYVPREIFNTELCLSIKDILMQALNGTESSFSTYFSDSVLARIHYLIRINPNNLVEYDLGDIEHKLVEVSRSWSDELKNHLLERFGEADALKYYAKYAKAFPASYTEYYKPEVAIFDIEQMEVLTIENPLGMSFYAPKDKANTALRLKLFHSEHPIALSDVLPTLENMGLRVIGERPHEMVLKDGRIVWINDFDIIYRNGKEIEVDAVREIFQNAFSKIWFRVAEDDGFNRLVLEAQLTWREVAVLRALTKYLRQTGFTFSQQYIETALMNHASIAKNLLLLFYLRFSPEYNESTRPDTTDLIKNIELAFDDVASLDEDRILRKILEVILAILRTNYFQKDENGQDKNYISFKFDPLLISDLPLPRPLYEIFVYSPRVEGVHLRGGKVARGGLRWSDRREDFRTEVLGLMKAQQVKNSVIVPVGAKGGFYPKSLANMTDRDDIMKEVIFCYQTFIRGLLDITDNIQNHQIVIPNHVVRYDEDDPYLVVAADKGTATFSDIANSLSLEYGFWLGDAFASGGSAGYDHKKMGITARGAWESVKRHFHEIGKDLDTDPFTVIGIGDMAGDVFGNGMLLSKQIQLIACFNHQHIFLDPNPDLLKSFDERKRLFHLPRSSWADYHSEVISAGGGVYLRSAKSIKLSPEIKKALSIEEDQLAPNDLIRAILKAPVDLLWNGGIGTFVKAANESHLDVGDRTNDAIRIDGSELRVRVVGEGGNLGFTQLGRVEYSLNGGIMYTDFIDNSAGVDCSDHEVNIKILLNKLVHEKKMTLIERDKLLGDMTDEVSTLVLRDNYEQTQMLSLEASVSIETMDLFRRYINELEKSGRLKRKLEFLPEDKALLERKANNKGLTRPEIAILLAYCKMYLKQDILASNIPEDPFFTRYLNLAFPSILCQKYFDEMKNHSLRREIIATQLGKSITDHMGVNFVERLQRETGGSVAFIMRAYVIAEMIFEMPSLWKEIEGLDSKVPVPIQHQLMLDIYYLIRRSTRWFLRNRHPDINIEESVKDFQPAIQELIRALPNLLTQDEMQLIDREVNYLEGIGVPKALAYRTTLSRSLYTALDIVEAARKHHFKITEVAEVYYTLGNILDLNWLRDQMTSYPVDNQWDELARSGYRDDLDRAQKRLAVSVLTFGQKKMTLKERVEAWLKHQELLITRWHNLIAEIKSSHSTGFVVYSVILRELFDFAQAG